MSEAVWVSIDTTLNLPSLEEKSKTSAIAPHPISSNRKNNFKENTLDDISETLIAQERSRDLGLKYALGTRVAEIPLTQPIPPKSKKENHSIWKKIQARTKEKTITLQKIIDAYGVINSITKKHEEYEVNARIYDLINHEMIDEITFSANEFTRSDRRKLVENAIFYWHVGKEKSIFGQERRVSEFRLRRVFNPESSKR